MSNIDYTLWPNAGGTLGQNKVQIPDGVTTTWPAGDALVGNFVFHKGHLVGFVDTKALTVNDSKSTTFPYDYVNIQVDKSLEGVMTFNQGERTKYFTVTYTESGNSGDTIVLGTKYLGCKTVGDVGKIESAYRTVDIIDGVWTQSLADLEKGGNGSFKGGMFGNCLNLISFTSDLSSLTNGSYMFWGCENLSSFNCANLSSLTDGSSMFTSCSNLTTFTSDLSSLTNGDYMFEYCQNLTTFTSDLSSLTDGSSMFTSCSNLTTFTSDLSSLTNGDYMFEYCENLTTFTSDLSSLTNGNGMFGCCSLDTASINNIAETINTVTDKPSIHIGIGNSTPTEEEHTYLTQIHEKGWSVYVNGSSNAYTPAVATLDETGETMTTPIPFWAKPVPSDEEHAKYTDSEGNFFDILGGQFIYVDDPDTYGMFLNEEDAATQMRLTKIEKK